MKRILGFALAALACIGLATPALADNIAITAQSGTVLRFAHADATANYTNATTSATDIAAATVTVPSTRYPITGTSASSSGVAQYVKACYTADATKATATTGTITLLVDGVSYAAAARSIGVMRGTLAACAYVARPVATALVVKLQGVSGDTNTFTVHNAQLSVEVLYFS